MYILKNNTTILIVFQNKQINVSRIETSMKGKQNHSFRNSLKIAISEICMSFNRAI